MNAEQLARKTEKQTTKLYNKYIRIGRRIIKSVMRKARKEGNYHANAYIDVLRDANTDLVQRVRSFLVVELAIRGFYVRKYCLAHSMEIFMPHEIYFAWGKDIERFQEIDAIQERIIRESIQEDTEKKEGDA